MLYVHYSSDRSHWNLVSIGLQCAVPPLLRVPQQYMNVNNRVSNPFQESEVPSLLWESMFHRIKLQYVDI